MEKEGGSIEIPEGMELSDHNFTCRYYPQDDMPLMPQYSSYEVRLETFKQIPNHCPEEIKLLAKTGFYFYGVKRDVCSKINLETKTLKCDKLDVAACFCCGNEIMIYHKHPRPLPVTHHLHCSFFKLPKDKEHIKESVRKYSGIQDYEFLEQQRKNMFEKRNISYENFILNVPDPPPIPLCLKCEKKERSVEYWPCIHEGFCISCAKSSSICLKCNMPYTALVRRFYD